MSTTKRPEQLTDLIGDEVTVDLRQPEDHNGRFYRNDDAGSFRRFVLEEVGIENPRERIREIVADLKERELSGEAKVHGNPKIVYDESGLVVSVEEPDEYCLFTEPFMQTKYHIAPRRDIQGHWPVGETDD